MLTPQSDPFAAYAALPPHTPAAVRATAARQLLSSADTEANLKDALRDPARRDLALEIITVEVSDRTGPWWYGWAVHWMHTAEATWQESANFCSDVAWMTRQRGRSAAVTTPTTKYPDPITARTVRHLRLTALRYEFQCKAIQDELAQDDRLDPYTQALAIFAALGLSQPAGIPAMHRLLDDPAAAREPKVLHTLLHGLWLGENLDRGAELTLDLLLRPPFDERQDPIALYREARARRRMGQLDRALTTIEQAIDVLPAGSPDVHADLVRERGLITLARDLRPYTVPRTTSVVDASHAADQQAAA